MIHSALFLMMAAAAVSAQEAVQPAWKLQGDLDAMSGQYFFNDGAGSINGYANADLQLLRPLSSDSGFYFTAKSAYTGFKQVDELAGGGTLFQQSMDNSLDAKWVKRFDGGYSLKPRVGVHSELFRETADESWGNGLYDFWRYEVGLVWERKTRLGLSVPWTYQFSLDVFYTRYMRFRALASQFGTEPGSPSPGSRVLDTVSKQLGYRNEFEFPGFVSAWTFYSIAFVDFTDQKVVQSQGQYLNSLRSDAYQTLNAGASKRFDDWPFFGRIRPIAALNLTVSDLISNQNYFDADPSRLKYIGSYYDYWEVRAAPSLGTTFLKTMTAVRMGCEVAMRQYTGRLAQNADASYKNSKLQQMTESFSLEVSHPIWKGIELKTRGSWSNTSANTAYEQTYTYNYHDYNYFMGLGWKF